MSNHSHGHNMKKLIALTVLFLSLGIFLAHADDDRPIAVNQLPQKAQQFIKTHFGNEKVSYAKVEDDAFWDKHYEVVFTSGAKIEFYKNGEWEQVDCKYTTVPKAIIPAQIAQYVSANFADVTIVQIDRSRRRYEVELSNKLELIFDKKFRPIGIDD